MSDLPLAVVSDAAPPVPLAQEIVEALSASLGDAIFATELAFCQGARRCDLWTISANSSAGFKARAYEVKISRADFRRDTSVKQREARLHLTIYENPPAEEAWPDMIAELLGETRTPDRIKTA